MKIIIAPNAFKQCLPADEVADSIARGIRKAFPLSHIQKIPVADGGDGTLSLLIHFTRGRVYKTKVIPPWRDQRKLMAKFGLLGRNTAGKFTSGKTAIIEMAEAAGLRLIPLAKRNPLRTHTYGVGELIKSALDKDASRIIIGLGGSGTVDGGVGMARSLGVRFLDRYGKEIGLGGGALSRLRHIDVSGLDKRLNHTEVIAACDTVNPLLGPEGAARTYGPQKGAGKEEVEILEENLSRLADVIQQDLGLKVKHLKGGGAAGGLGAGCYAFLSAKLGSGIKLFLELIDFKRWIKNADLVIVGEGKIDGSTIYGKAPMVVAQVAKKTQKKTPVIAICGSLGNGYQKALAAGPAYQTAKIDAAFSISKEEIPLSESIRNARRLIEDSTARMVPFFFALRDRTIVLASGSQRRKELLQRIIPQFKIMLPRVKEGNLSVGTTSPYVHTQILARRKAQTIGKKVKNALIIAADTVVFAQSRIIGKPGNKKESFKILKGLAGTRHSVITGICLLDTCSGRIISGYEETVVRMKRISDGKIRRLIRTGKDLDKAGGYAIQEAGDKYIKIIKGSLSNAVGLPLDMVTTMLSRITNPDRDEK